MPHGFVSLPLVIIIVISSFVIVNLSQSKPANPNSTSVNLEDSGTAEAKRSLQLRNLTDTLSSTPPPSSQPTPPPSIPGYPTPGYATPSYPTPPYIYPTPYATPPDDDMCCGPFQTGSCTGGIAGGFVDDCSQCCGGEFCIPVNNPGNWTIPGYVGNPTGEFWCEVKPIIYLYPEKAKWVDVVVEIPGFIIASIPHYPPEGWLGVYAYPNGKLFYRGKTYPELFYEVALEPGEPLPHGYIVAKADIEKKLFSLGKELGFNDYESDQLATFWHERLNDNIKNPFVHISFFDHDQKQKLDRVIITPKPDVFIEYIFYFKGVDQPYPLDPPKIPPMPSRYGFTAVEWGGIIDQ
jgi:hypothetical protein